MAVFYQKYRPVNFAEVVGQSPIVTTLQNASKNGSFGHAYLFTGGRGLGKTTLARIVAKAANCSNLKKGDPCGACESCSAIATGKFLDCIEIDAASHTGVDNIRELIESIGFKPTLGKMKVYIIDEVHMLSKAAFNALLKTLEEPPSHSMFILATTDIEKVPETIISRAQRFDFRKVSDAEILKALQKIVELENLSLPGGALEVVVENAEGGMRDALSQLSTISVLDKNASLAEVNVLLGSTDAALVYNLLENIIKANLPKISQFFLELNNSGIDPVSFNKKTLLVLKSILDTILMGKPVEHFSQITLPDAVFTTRLFLRSIKEVPGSVEPVLPLVLASSEAAMYFAKKNSNTAAVGVMPVKPEAKPIETASPEVSASISSVEPSSLITKNIEPEAVQTSLDESLTLEQVKIFWPSLISEIKKQNSPLSTLLKNSPIVSVSGGVIVLGVKYVFHQENIESLKNRSLIENLILQLQQKNVRVKTVLQNNSSLADKDPVSGVVSALQVFGGELIE